MKGLIDVLLVFFLSLMLAVSCVSGFETVMSSIAVFSVCALVLSFRVRLVRIFAAAAFLALSVFYHPAALMLAPVAYCFADSNDRRDLLLLLPTVFVVFTDPLVYAVSALILTGVSWLLCIRRKNNDELEERLRVTRDTGVENSLVLAERNRRLIEQQDSEVKLATLKERNRIAREIHDNVGHTLSRSVLQLGAIMAITKNDEQLSSLLTPLRESLDSAMDNIRVSVHDLRDNSIDMQLSVREILKPLEDRYKIDLQYDISDNIAADIKLCFLAVIKESVSNTLRHSSADSITVIISEQPNFAKLVVSDNGREINPGDGSGMGLSNMQERVRQLGGNINMTRENGFRIYITVPKNVQKGADR